MPSRAYIAVGSNIDPTENIPAATLLLKDHVRIGAVSTFYVTKALGNPEQPDYRNGVLEIETTFDAISLRNTVLRPIEDQLGRVRTHDPCAARTIDLDVVLHSDTVLHTDELELPATDIRERAFVAVPLLELAPNLVLPDTGERLSELKIAQVTENLVPDNTLTHNLKERLGL